MASKKLNKKTIEDLILEVLQEDFVEPVAKVQSIESLNSFLQQPYYEVNEIDLLKFKTHLNAIREITRNLDNSTPAKQKMNALEEFYEHFKENKLTSPHKINKRIKKMDDEYERRKKIYDLFIKKKIFTDKKPAFSEQETTPATKKREKLKAKIKDLQEKNPELLPTERVHVYIDNYKYSKKALKSYKTDIEALKKSLSTQYGELFNKHKTILGQSLPAFSLDQDPEAFDLEKIKQTSGDIKDFDVYSTDDIFKANFNALNVELTTNILTAIQDIISTQINKIKQNSFDSLKQLKEDTTRFNIDDIAALFAKTTGQVKDDDVVDVDEKTNITPKQIKQALINSYRVILKATKFKGATKEAALKSIKDLIDSVDYFASKRAIRTKTDAFTGFTLGTAATSGAARISKELGSVFNNISTKSTITGKFEDLIKFLSEVNHAVFNESATITGTLEEKFSRFVALEVLSDNIFNIQEATVRGNLFEAFLAMFLGGVQVGSDRGGADFRVGDVEGSAKLISSSDFKQATKNLIASPNMLYVIATKSTKAAYGVKKLAAESDRVMSIDIHLYDVITTTKGKSKATPANKPKAAPIVGKSVRNDTKFNLTSASQKESYIGTLDFSFMFSKEFRDVSSTVMKIISEEVEMAFSALVNLRNNISRWIIDKDIVAANQVKYNEKKLNAAIEKLESKVEVVQESKKKSIKDLDKLIEQVILESLSKK